MCKKVMGWPGWITFATVLAIVWLCDCTSYLLIMTVITKYKNSTTVLVYYQSICTFKLISRLT